MFGLTFKSKVTKLQGEVLDLKQYLKISEYELMNTKIALKDESTENVRLQNDLKDEMHKNAELKSNLKNRDKLIKDKQNWLDKLSSEDLKKALGSLYSHIVVHKKDAKASMEIVRQKYTGAGKC
jgi:CII-binding regulator of phage lambda lysogenization HflD